MGWLNNRIGLGLEITSATLLVGQLAGQRMLQAIRPSLADVVESASRTPDDDLTTQAPGYAITSARHESQYSRLFRS